MRHLMLSLLLTSASFAGMPPQSTLPIGKMPPQSTLAVEEPEQPVQKATHRYPIGHTHTCKKCGNVWDHTANPGHNCANCGRPEYVQDRVPRLVPLSITSMIPQADPGCATGG